MSEVMRCWPTKWLEAAGKAGLASYVGNGQWNFREEGLREKLEIFGLGVRDAVEDDMKRQSEADAMKPQIESDRWGS